MPDEARGRSKNDAPLFYNHHPPLLYPENCLFFNTTINGVALLVAFLLP